MFAMIFCVLVAGRGLAAAHAERNLQPGSKIATGQQVCESLGPKDENSMNGQKLNSDFDTEAVYLVDVLKHEEMRLSELSEQPSVYFLADTILERKKRRMWFSGQRGGTSEKERGWCEELNRSATFTDGNLDLHRWQLAKKRGENHHTHNLQFVHEDFEYTGMFDKTPDDINKHLAQNKIDVVLCWESWTGRSVPPVYLETQRGGEPRVISSWIGALLALGHNVLVADFIPSENVNTCTSRIVQDLIGPGKAILGAQSNMIAAVGATEGMIESEPDQWPISLKPCMFGMGYFASQFVPHIVSMPNKLTFKGNGSTIDMMHIGFSTQCWSAEPLSDDLKDYVNSIVFWMKGGLNQFPPCMQEKDFWQKLSKLVKMYNAKTGKNIKITALAPSRDKGTPEQVLGKQLLQMFDAAGVQYLTHLLSHNQLMGLLRHSVLMFGMGQTPGSPMPLDAMECGSSVLLPRGQHTQLLDLMPDSANLPFHAFDTCEDLLENVGKTLDNRDEAKLRDYTIADYQPDRIIRKMGIFVSTLQKTCEAGLGGLAIQDELTSAGKEARLTGDGLVLSEQHKSV